MQTIRQIRQRLIATYHYNIFYVLLSLGCLIVMLLVFDIHFISVQMIYPNILIHYIIYNLEFMIINGNFWYKTSLNTWVEYNNFGLVKIKFCLHVAHGQFWHDLSQARQSESIKIDSYEANSIIPFKRKINKR